MKFALFENTQDNNIQSLIFTELDQEITCSSLDNIDATYNKITSLAKAGLYLIGYIAYDLIENSVSNQPLICYQAYKKLIKCANHDLINTLTNLGLIRQPTNINHLKYIESELNQSTYNDMYAKVQQNLKSGNSYQINLTHRFNVDLSSINEFSLYYQLSRANNVAYASYLHTQNEQIISISPELFFHKIADKIITKPMKGTSAASEDYLTNAKNATKLANDQKNIAENLIIVDLLRNDLAKIANTNTVKVNKLFTIEKYSTVLQMTSEIEAQINTDILLQTILKALFPCGSITGAPKKRTIELIQQIEKSKRGIYTGCIGYILPNNEMLFNVAIRTLTKNSQEQFAKLGAGGGITIQSNASGEWAEIQTKLRFLTQFYHPEFKLVESVLIQHKQIKNLDLHLQRLKNSADHLLFKCDINAIQHKIENYVIQHDLFNLEHIYKLRLELDYQHNLLIEHIEIETNNSMINLALLTQKLNTQHFMFKYKTTSNLTRGIYTKLHNQYSNEGIDEIIYLNQDNQVTESRFHNLIINYAGRLITPPISCGLLAGIYRHNMLERKTLTEEIITPEMLNHAEEIYLCNDIRGLIKCNYTGIIN